MLFVTIRLLIGESGFEQVCLTAQLCQRSDLSVDLRWRGSRSQREASVRPVAASDIILW